MTETNWFLVYLISLIDNMSAAGTAICVGCSAVAALMLLPWGIHVSDGNKYSHKEGDLSTADRLMGIIKKLVATALVALVFSVFVPSTRGLIQAYVMVEGSKVVNAKNAEAATKEIVKRIDTLIEKIGGK